MRPTGVRQRIEQLRDQEIAWAQARPHLSLRRSLSRLIQGCARYSYGDVAASVVVADYRSVVALLGDSAQQRTGSDLEIRSFECLQLMQSHDGLITAAANAHRNALQDEDLAGDAFVTIPPRALLNRDTAESVFPMACFNAAGSLMDGVISAYTATKFIISVGFYEPEEERDLLVEMRDARLRYEGEPGNRSAISTEISGRLYRWLREMPVGG